MEIPNGIHRGAPLRVELAGAIGAADTACHFFLGIIRQEQGKDLHSPFLIAKRHHGLNVLQGDLRECLGDEKTPICRQPLDDSLCGITNLCLASGAAILQVNRLFHHIRYSAEALLFYYNVTSPVNCNIRRTKAQYILPKSEKKMPHFPQEMGHHLSFISVSYQRPSNRPQSQYQSFPH